ncbi:hypothetical protein BKA61DRAFT_641602 [Leptodontidium sp. MPI-SDFR-AT-0119]|nr:hypothetical protein BKA61DRAFT_641602 [Leptodontidium sp. MPI-SDFR-AT-0119]
MTVLRTAQKRALTRYPSFQLVETQALAGLGLTATCESVLYQILKCDNFTSQLGSSSYHGSLGDADLTTSVCDATCSASLSTFHRRVAAACASTPDLYPGFPALALIDSIWGGWNETCLKDNTTAGSYCNDIIDAWAPVEDIADMPKTQLCSFCYGSKLAVMRQNPYGIYDGSNFKDRYDYTIKVKSGDTCDSISQASLISSGTLYETNPLLFNCSAPAVGLELCLPPQCEKLYTVEATDDCVTIGVKTGISWLNVVAYNGMINSYCSNIYNAIPSWGHTICVSPPGGTFINAPTNTSGGDLGGPGGTGDGYANTIVTLPAGSKIATGTTKNCGEFYLAKTGDTCGSIITNEKVNTPSDLFIGVNPSLVSAELCTSKLIVGRYYCVHPTRGWNDTSTTMTMTISAGTSSITRISSTSSPSPSKV